MKIGFIGMGIMGSRMASNLQQQGHELIIFNRTEDKVSHLVANGALSVATPVGVAQQVTIIFTMLAHPDAVREVALSNNGFLNILQAGSLWIDCSTVNPTFSRQMAAIAVQRQIKFIDAPVGGSKIQAEQKELVFLVGAEQKNLANCRNLLECMGKRIVHVGEPGMGNALKLVINLLLGISMAGFAEAMVLGEAWGISSEMLLKVLIGSPVVAPFLASKQEKLQQSQYEAEFPLQWMQKDLQMVAIAGYESNVPLPLANTTKEIYQQAIQQGLGQQDFAAIYDFWQSNFKHQVNSDRT